MLATRQRFARNPYFHFHSLHTLFALLGALILFALLVWFLAVPARRTSFGATPFRVGSNLGKDVNP